jgi:plasmid stability protein
MATITIRNLDDQVKRDLQLRAALNGRSMEAEAREMIADQVKGHPARARKGLGTAIHERFAALGGVELNIPPRQFSSRPANNLEDNFLEGAEPKEGLGTAIHKLFAPLGGVELQIPARRKTHRPIPTFES